MLRKDAFWTIKKRGWGFQVEGGSAARSMTCDKMPGIEGRSVPVDALEGAAGTDLDEAAARAANRERGAAAAGTD